MSEKTTECPTGYCIDMFDGSVRITQDGKVTDKWEERGTWPMLDEAEAARERFSKPTQRYEE